MLKPPPSGPVLPHGVGPRIPTSVLLERLVHDAPAGEVTLGWLLYHLSSRSFGIVLLMLGVCAVLPGVSLAIGLLITIPAIQMILGHPAPVFPARVADHPIAAHKLVAALGRVIPALRYLERFVRPRWPTPFKATRRVIGGFVLLLGLGLLIPVPLSNVPLGLIIILVAFAHLEEDGVLLAIAFAITLALLGAGAGAIWSTVTALLRMVR